MMKNVIKKISIRARVGYALECLEVILKEKAHDKKTWKFLLSKLWEYTYTENLGEWHYRISEMTPFSILENIPYSKKACEYLTKAEHNILKEIYTKTDKKILVIIDLVFEIGTLDLYSSIVDGSPRTVILLEKIIKILEYEKIKEIPLLPYLRYDISKNNGWGEPFNKSDILPLVD